MLSLIVSIGLRLLSTAMPHQASAMVQTEEANGSVWANVLEGGSVRSTVRLCDVDPRLRFVPVDVDGDGRIDVVAYALDGRRLMIWRATEDGFVRI